MTGASAPVFFCDFVIQSVEQSTIFVTGTHRSVEPQTKETAYERTREIRLLFYYPSAAYLSDLMAVDELEFYGEIDCGDLFAGEDHRERIVVFSLPGYQMGNGF